MAPATIGEEFVTELHIGSEGIVLEETRLDSLKRRLGAGPIGDAGDAASSIEWLCLRGGAGPKRWVLWLESGEMGAGTVEGFHLVSVYPDAHIDRRCSSVPPRVGKIEFPKQLALGLPDSVVRQVLGPPSAVAGDTLIYRYSRHVIDSLPDRTSPGEYDVQNRVFLVIGDGRVVQIAGWRSTTE